MKLLFSYAAYTAAKNPRLFCFTKYQINIAFFIFRCCCYYTSFDRIIAIMRPPTQKCIFIYLYIYLFYLSGHMALQRGVGALLIVTQKEKYIILKQQGP